MADQIKPRYRLGTQHMLDLAKDDATKIPERTLFMIGDSWVQDKGAVVVRYNNEIWVPSPHSVAFVALDGSNFFDGHDTYSKAYFSATDLQPLI